MSFRWRKHLIVLETCVCFIPVSLLLLYGVAATPMLAVGIAAGKVWILWLLVAELAGIAGLVGVFQLIIWLVGHARAAPNHKKTLLLMCLGVMSTVGFWVFYLLPSPDPPTLITVVLILPLLCTVHLGYVACNFLLRGAESNPLSYDPRAA